MSALCDEYWEREFARRSNVLALEDEDRVREDSVERPAEREVGVLPQGIVPDPLSAPPLGEKKRAPRALAR